VTDSLSRCAMTDVLPGGGFTARAHFDAPLHVVEMSGELDEAGRVEAIRTCTLPDHLDVLVDLSGLTFMGCAGYDALVTSTSILEHRGGSLVMVNPVGAPRRLLELIEALDRGLCAPLRYGPRSVPPVRSWLPAQRSIGGRSARRWSGRGGLDVDDRDVRADDRSEEFAEQPAPVLPVGVVDLAQV
jgi:anti-anti-sigma factor